MFPGRGWSSGDYNLLDSSRHFSPKSGKMETRASSIFWNNKGCPEGTYNTGRCTKTSPPRCACKPGTRPPTTSWQLLPCPEGTYNTGICTKSYKPKCLCKPGTQPTRPQFKKSRLPQWLRGIRALERRRDVTSSGSLHSIP